MSSNEEVIKLADINKMPEEMQKKMLVGLWNSDSYHPCCYDEAFVTHDFHFRVRSVRRGSGIENDCRYMFIADCLSDEQRIWLGLQNCSWDD